MKKIFIIVPDKAPYSLCGKSFVKAFEYSEYYVESAYSSELDNNEVLKFNPDIVMCFNFNELNEGFFDEIRIQNPECIFIFDFLTVMQRIQDIRNIEGLMEFEGNKILLTADKTNLDILPNAVFLPNGVNYKQYKSEFSGCENGITLMSNPDNINVLQVIIDLIKNFGKITFYADETDYIKSLDNELWEDVEDESIKELFKQSYSGDVFTEKDRAKIFSSTLITVVPETGITQGIDYRVLEAAASSAFVICEENSEVIKQFDVGKEIETYKRISELRDKVSFYLKNPSIARSIAENARLAAVNNHSAFDRVKKITEIIRKEFKK